MAGVFGAGRLDSRAGFTLEVEGQPGREVGLALQGRLQEELDRQVANLARAYTEAAAIVKAADTRELQADIAAGGFYRAERLAKTWRGRVYPQGSKTSLEPSVLLFNKAGIIVDAFSSGVTITVHNAQFLAIPTETGKAILRRLNLATNRTRTAGGRFAGEDNPVARVAAALGVDLVPVIARDGARGVLFAAGHRLTRTGRESKAKGAGPDRPLFVLVKHATLRKRIQGQALIERIEGRFPADFTRALSTTLPAENRE